MEIWNNLITPKPGVGRPATYHFDELLRDGAKKLIIPIDVGENASEEAKKVSYALHRWKTYKGRPPFHTAVRNEVNAIVVYRIDFN